jgi:hypothetical protein
MLESQIPLVMLCSMSKGNAAKESHLLSALDGTTKVNGTSLPGQATNPKPVWDVRPGLDTITREIAAFFANPKTCISASQLLAGSAISYTPDPIGQASFVTQVQPKHYTETICVIIWLIFNSSDSTSDYAESPEDLLRLLQFAATYECDCEYDSDNSTREVS